MEEIKLEIKTIDKLINYATKKVFIFTSKYKKKLGKNEFHNPGPARIIFELKNKIINLLFMDLMIETDKQGNVLARSSDFWEKIIQKKEYYNFEDLKKAKELFIIYKTKGLEYLKPDEISEYSWAKNVVEVFKVQTLKIPFYIGGGF